MALRSRSHTAIATSGPGRGPASDGRSRHHRPHSRGRPRQRRDSADELRSRAEALFAERAGEWRESGQGWSGAVPDAPDAVVRAPGAAVLDATAAEASVGPEVPPADQGTGAGTGS